MKRPIILIAALFLIFSCTQEEEEIYIIKSIQDSTPSNNSSQTESTYLALGDSYTIGQSVLAEDSFPFILVNDLNNTGNSFTAPKVIARTGWTTKNLKTAIFDENIQQNYDLVSLLIGVNNQYQGGSVAEFRTEYTELLEMAIMFANNNPSNVIVLSIPDWSISPFGQNSDQVIIGQEIDDYNAVKKEITLNKQVSFIEITEITRQAEGNEAYFASDQLHFSGLMHQLWVDEILKYKFVN